MKERACAITFLCYSFHSPGQVIHWWKQIKSFAMSMCAYVEAILH